MKKHLLIFFIGISSLLVSCSKDQDINCAGDSEYHSAVRQTDKLKVTVDFRTISDHSCQVTFKNLDNISEPLVYARYNVSGFPESRGNGSVKVKVDLRKNTRYEVRYDFWFNQNISE